MIVVLQVAESLAGDLVRSRLIVVIDSECQYPRYESQIQHAQGKSKPWSPPEAGLPVTLWPLGLLFRTCDANLFVLFELMLMQKWVKSNR